MYLSLTILPIFGALWDSAQYYAPIQILLLFLITIMVLLPVFLKNNGQISVV
jgi:hypothetical protein